VTANCLVLFLCSNIITSITHNASFIYCATDGIFYTVNIRQASPFPALFDIQTFTIGNEGIVPLISVTDIGGVVRVDRDYVIYVNQTGNGVSFKRSNGQIGNIVRSEFE
jgi:hypothetical protein